jgi:hypothetical protein
VLVRIRVSVDADHRGGGAGEDVGAVALAAGHIEDPQTGGAGGDPLVDDEVAPVPVVLLGQVGQRALAGQRQRRHARRLVQLEVPALHPRHRIDAAVIPAPGGRA